MSCWALIPVKSNAAGKSRLACVLGDEDRADLVTGMFRHVLATVKACEAIPRVSVMGPSRPNLGAGVIRFDDPGNGLNAGLASVVAAIAASGSERVVVLPADLPQVTIEDVTRLATLRGDTLGIAPDRHGSGTNALSLPLPLAAWFPFGFGEQSYARHCAEAEKLGLTVVTINSATLAKDIDVPADLPDAASMLDNLRNAGAARRRH